MTNAGEGTTQEESTYTIQAEVKDNHGVQNVQATIVLYPSLDQVPTEDQGLVEEPAGQIIELQPQGEGIYRANQDFATELGVYKVHLYAIDDNGLRSAPMIFDSIDRTSKLYLPIVEE